MVIDVDARDLHKLVRFQHADLVSKQEDVQYGLENTSVHAGKFCGELHDVGSDSLIAAKKNAHVNKQIKKNSAEKEKTNE